MVSGSSSGHDSAFFSAAARLVARADGVPGLLPAEDVQRFLALLNVAHLGREKTPDIESINLNVSGVDRSRACALAIAPRSWYQGG